jgi:saccharopine dehydrogenase-like NADP-dependent oxidoreductase
LALGPKLGPKGEIELSNGFLNSTRFRYSVESVSYENRKLIYAAPRGNPESCIFRDPIGALTVTQSPGSAVISLSQSFPKIKHITLKTAGNPDFDKNVGLLRNLGFFGNTPINVKGEMVSPWDVLVALIGKLPPETKAPDIRSEARVVVRGEEAGKEVEYSISWLRIGSSAAKVHIIASSGLCAAISAVMLGRGQTKGKGVLMPEVCIPPELFLNEFANAGMEIEIVKKMKV